MSRPAGKPPVLDQTSVTDLTASVTDGRLIWTAPAGAEWVVLSYWQRGSGQRPEAGPHTEPETYVVDHYSLRGSQAVFDFWDRAVLTKEIRKALRKSGGNIFEDSLEMETEATLWTDDLLPQFAERRGYRLEPYLAASSRSTRPTSSPSRGPRPTRSASTSPR